MGHGFWWHATRILVANILWPIFKGIGRFFVGLPVDGHMRTDATFLDDGKNDIRKPSYWSRRNVSRWARLAGWKRLVIRWVIVVGLPLTIFLPESRYFAAILVAAWIALKVYRRSQAKEYADEVMPGLFDQIEPDHTASMASGEIDADDVDWTVEAIEQGNGVRR